MEHKVGCIENDSADIYMAAMKPRWWQVYRQGAVIIQLLTVESFNVVPIYLTFPANHFSRHVHMQDGEFTETKDVYLGKKLMAHVVQKLDNSSIEIDMHFRNTQKFYRQGSDVC